MRFPFRRSAATTGRAMIGSFACALAIACFCSHDASALIRVVKSNGDAVPATAYTLEFDAVTGGWNITLHTLYNPGGESVFEIRANAGEFLDNVIIDVDGPAAGSPVIVRVLGETPGLLGGVGAIVQTGTCETILNRVQTSGDIGPVQVEAIGDLLAGRDVLGPIVATTGNNPARGITSVQAVRDILGDVTADNGRILLVWAQRHIGTQKRPITIRAKHNVYHVMGDDVFANINTRFNNGTGGFWALVANRFSGTLETQQLIPNPWNGLNALMEIYNQFDGKITIGQGYTSPTQYIQVPTHGLGGQIIINADNVGGNWSAPVRIGPPGDPQQIVLNSPNYTHTLAQVGGGAVGVVPFRLHDEACSPANGATLQQGSGAPPVQVQLRHYGPVTWATSPLAIERRIAGSTGSYTSLSLSGFTITRSADERSIIVAAAPGQPGFQVGYQYRIRRTPQLLCSVAATPPVFWDGDYLLAVINPPCVGDLNADAQVNINDLLLVISFWGPTNPAFPAADINSDGVVNIDDLLQVISRWGACP